MSWLNQLTCKREPICKGEVDIITIFEKPVINYPIKGNTEIFSQGFVVAEKNRVNRQKYINSFAKDVGIMNICQKLAQAKENFFDGRFAVKKDSYVDLRGMPKDGEQLANMMTQKDKIWKGLDPELKKSMTYEQFVDSFTLDDFNAYIKSKVEAKTKVTTEVTKDKKEGE